MVALPIQEGQQNKERFPLRVLTKTQTRTPGEIADEIISATIKDEGFFTVVKALSILVATERLEKTANIIAHYSDSLGVSELQLKKTHRAVTRELKKKILALLLATSSIPKKT